MAVLADQIVPLANYPTGTIRIGFGGQGGNPLTVPDTTNSCDIQVQRCTNATPTIWPNVTTTLETIPEISIDGGVTWIESGRNKAGGGIVQSKNGGELAFSPSGGSLPVGLNRLYRCTFIIENGPLRTSANVIVD